MEFVLVQNSKALGPFSVERVRQEIKSGKIQKNAQIWRPPWRSWVKIGSVFPSEFGFTKDFITEMESRGEILHKAQKDIFERVEEQVPATFIREVLKQARDNTSESTDIRTTAKNKEDLVYKNLREAVSQGHIERIVLERLIREFSETGGQRIFLYRAKPDFSATKAGMTIDEVGTTLVGKNWEATLPKYHDLPPTPQISSLRSYKLTSDQRRNPYGFVPSMADGWILTIDATIQTEQKLQSGQHKAKTGDITTHVYAASLEPAVIVLRFWEKLQLLELRIPNYQNHSHVFALRDLIMENFGAQLAIQSYFDEWSLATACTKLLDSLLNNPHKEPTLRRISGTMFRESDRSTMRMEIENQTTGSVLASAARRDSVAAYLEAGSRVESAIAFFQPSNPTASEKNTTDSEIRIVVAHKAANEISVRKIINAWHLDHVIIRLFQNS